MSTGLKIGITVLVGLAIAGTSYYFLIYKANNPKPPVTPGGGNNGSSNNGSGNNNNNNNNTGTVAPPNTTVGLNTGSTTGGLNTNTGIAPSLVGKMVKAKFDLTSFYDTGWFSEIGSLIKKYSKNDLLGIVQGVDQGSNKWYKIVTPEGKVGFVLKTGVAPV